MRRRPPTIPIIERLLARAELSEYPGWGDTLCWLWQGNRLKAGYGLISAPPDDPRKMQLVHQASWEHYHGPVPAGLELDHRCRVEHCFNPDHLEAVTHGVNVHRAQSVSIVCSKCGRWKLGENQRWMVSGRTRTWQLTCRHCVNKRARERRNVHTSGGKNGGKAES